MPDGSVGGVCDGGVSDGVGNCVNRFVHRGGRRMLKVWTQWEENKLRDNSMCLRSEEETYLGSDEGTEGGE